jgi:hypothetical protein
MEHFVKTNAQTPPHQAAWNRGKLVGQKTPLKLKEIGDDPNPLPSDRKNQGPLVCNNAGAKIYDVIFFLQQIILIDAVLPVSL